MSAEAKAKAEGVSPECRELALAEGHVRSFSTNRVQRRIDGKHSIGKSKVPSTREAIAKTMRGFGVHPVGVNTDRVRMMQVRSFGMKRFIAGSEKEFHWLARSSRFETRLRRQ